MIASGRKSKAPNIRIVTYKILPAARFNSNIYELIAAIVSIEIGVTQRFMSSLICLEATNVPLPDYELGPGSKGQMCAIHAADFENSPK